MYTGKISMENYTRDDIIKLLKAAEELKLDELSEFLQDHLMQKKEYVTDNNTQNLCHVTRSNDLQSHGNKCGKIRLIGAGPGDPKLLTLAAFQAIQEADLILSDKLVSDEVLKLIPKHIEVFIAARKFCANVEAAQAELNRVGLDALNLGKDVVRLKQGGKY
jgi:hypothetical protein